MSASIALEPPLKCNQKWAEEGLVAYTLHALTYITLHALLSLIFFPILALEKPLIVAWSPCVSQSLSLILLSYFESAEFTPPVGCSGDSGPLCPLVCLCCSSALCCLEKWNTA